DHAVASTTTDDDGRFQFQDVDSYDNVFVQAASFAFGGATVSSKWPDSPTEIRLLPPAKLQVRFVDADNKPAAGIGIKMTVCGESRNGWRSELPADLETSVDQTTDADGVCTFTGIPQGGIAWLQPSDDRFAMLDYTEQFELNDTDFTDGGAVKLLAAASISGKVIDAATGKPPPQRIVVMARNVEGNGNADTFTDEQGRYFFKQLRPGNYCVFLFLSND